MMSIRYSKRRAQRSKYGVDTSTKGKSRRMFRGILFDSMLEKNRYIVLLAKEQAGEISNLELQPEFELMPGFEHNGKKVRAIKYKADFSYTVNGVRVVEDTKGYETDVFKLKQKLFWFNYPEIPLKIIKAKNVSK